jgi:hypothetical protein
MEFSSGDTAIAGSNRREMEFFTDESLVFF